MPAGKGQSPNGDSNPGRTATIDLHPSSLPVSSDKEVLASERMIGHRGSPLSITPREELCARQQAAGKERGKRLTLHHAGDCRPVACERNQGRRPHTFRSGNAPDSWTGLFVSSDAGRCPTDSSRSSTGFLAAHSKVLASAPGSSRPHSRRDNHWGRGGNPKSHL